MISEIHFWHQASPSSEQKSTSEVAGKHIDVASSVARLKGHLENFSPSAKEEALLLAQALPSESTLTALLLDSLAEFDFDTAMQHLETLQDRVITGNLSNG